MRLHGIWIAFNFVQSLFYSHPKRVITNPRAIAASAPPPTAITFKPFEIRWSDFSSATYSTGKTASQWWYESKMIHFLYRLERGWNRVFSWRWKINIILRFSFSIMNEIKTSAKLWLRWIEKWAIWIFIRSIHSRIAKAMSSFWHRLLRIWADAFACAFAMDFMLEDCKQ